MKKIDVVELYITKRIELLERENGEYKIHKKEISELKDVLDCLEFVLCSYQFPFNINLAFVCSYHVMHTLKLFRVRFH